MNDTLSLRQQHLRWVLNAFTTLFIALAVIGALRAYSPVPFFDMWKSYVPFLDQTANGDWSVWWHQHNEHRILLARLFFWLDLRWFEGAGWFLIVVNYALAAAGAMLFCRILREVPVPQGRALDMHALTVFIIMALFFWCQSENLTWGFQSQFFLAQLIPLAALYALYRSTQGGNAQFALACLLGILSIATMANGVLALPLMTLYAMLTRQGVRRTCLLAALTAIALFAYFYDYSAVGGHGSLSQTLGAQPVLFVRYVLMYLGSPFNFMVSGSGFGGLVAQFAGLFLLVSSARFVWLALKQFRQPQNTFLPLALLFFIAYIAGTAAGTAGGRLIFGLEQALSYRYTTPAIMAWVALLILYAPTLFALQERSRRAAWWTLAIISLLMLGFQLKALNSRTDELFNRAVGALAIELRITDTQEIGHVYPNTLVLKRTEQASDNRRSVFGLYPYRDARAQMGASFEPIVLPTCLGALDIAEIVEGDNRVLRVDGWLFEPVGKKAPQVVRFLDNNGKQVGYALGGKTRVDVASAIDKAANRAGYRGYIFTAALGPTLTLRGEAQSGPFCELKLNAPPVPPFSYVTGSVSAARSTVSSASLLNGNAWLGADFDKSSMAGMRVYGSFITSDADRGSISIRVKRGDRFYYRSGPTPGRQTIEINGSKAFVLPLAKNWILLDLSSEELPEGLFTVTLSDNGNDWGEWSAIALKSD